MRRTLFALTFLLGAASLGAPAFAQAGIGVGSKGPQDTEKVKQVFVYGDDPCPKGEGDEIVVCARMPDNDRYRIPKDLRTDPNSPSVQAWGNRARALETVSVGGVQSCSPSGAAGAYGCFQRLAKAAKEERQKMLGSATYSDAVEAERRKRLGNLDAESDAIEAEAKLDEASAAARERAQQMARERAAERDAAEAAAKAAREHGQSPPLTPPPATTPTPN